MSPLQIWKQHHQIKRSDQFTVNERDTDCFDHLHEENTMPLVILKDLWGFFKFCTMKGVKRYMKIMWMVFSKNKTKQKKTSCLWQLGLVAVGSFLDSHHAWKDPVNRVCPSIYPPVSFCEIDSLVVCGIFMVFVTHMRMWMIKPDFSGKLPSGKNN